MTVLIIQPLQDDVLCGKDNKNHSNHAGNKLYRSLIFSYLGEYKITLRKREKMNITKLIVNRMKNEYNTRFLIASQTPTVNMDRSTIVSWVELTDVQARDKTSHALRFLTKQLDNKTDDKAICKKEAQEKINQTKIIKRKNQFKLPCQNNIQVCYTKNIDADLKVVPQIGCEILGASLCSTTSNGPLISDSDIIQESLVEQLWRRQQEILHLMDSDGSNSVISMKRII